MKVDTATRFGAKPANAEAAPENVKAGLALVDQLLEIEDFAAATRVISALLPVAGSSTSLRAEVQKRQRDITAIREASEKVTRHLEKLKTAPDDPPANLEVGKYLCFFKNDWKNGIPALARGSDPALKAAAIKEQAGAQDAEAQAALGDLWWEAAQSSTGSAKSAMQSHAGDWYTRNKTTARRAAHRR